MVNQTLFTTQVVSLDAGAQTTVHFSVPGDKVGTYNISVGDLKDSFNVSLTPASFKVSSLSISPDNADIGQKVEISITATNTGQSSGTYEIKLNVNGTVQDSKQMSLEGGESQQAVFNYVPDESGEKTIGINGLTGELTVKAATPSVTTSPPTVLTTIPTKPVETNPQEISTNTKTNPWLITVIIGCLVLAGVFIIFYLIWRRKRTKTSA